MLAGPLQTVAAPNCDGKIVFYSHFAEGARHKGEQAVGQGQEQDLSPGLGVGIAPSCGGQHLLHSPTWTSLTSRYVHAASELITVQLPVWGWCRGVSDWMNEIFHRKRFLINYS